MAIRVNFLIGCTASGKGRVGRMLARRLGGEILSVDSMKIYRRMDIGTAKPSKEDLAAVRHHLIDVVEPSEPFSLGRYVELADQAIADMASRGRPILAVGGTMLYVQGLASGVFDGPAADPEFRRELRERAAREGVPALHAELARVDPETAARVHPNDLRRIERALEVHRSTGEPISVMQTQWAGRNPRYDCRLVALRSPTELSNRRINGRVKRMVDAGLVDEVRGLLAEPGGIGPQAGQAVGYAEIIAHLGGQMSLDQAIERVKINSRHLSKHQRTWMRRIDGIHFIDVAEADTAEQVADRVAGAWGMG